MPTQRSAAAATIVFVQAGLLALLGLLLVGLRTRRRRSFSKRFLHAHLLGHPAAWGLVLVLVGVGLVVLGVGLLHTRPWATVVAYATEAVLGLGGLIGFHPVRSLLGLALAVAVIFLVATDHHAVVERQ